MDSHHAFVAEATYRDRVRDRLAEADRERIARHLSRHTGFAEWLLRLIQHARESMSNRSVGRETVARTPTAETGAPVVASSEQPAELYVRYVPPARAHGLHASPSPDAPPSRQTIVDGAQRPTRHRLDGRHLQARYGR